MNLENVSQVQGKMALMCNSFDILLKNILEKNSLSIKGSFRTRIKNFIKLLNTLKLANNIDINKLIDDLFFFDDTWTIVKHGNPVFNLEPVTFIFENKTHSFSLTKMTEIENRFTKTQLQFLKALGCLEKSKV